MIQLMNVRTPKPEANIVPIALSDETMVDRRNKVLAQMETKGYDAIVIYADLEHGGNFEYLVGFLPRFEEAMLVLHKDASAYMVLGNENLNKASKSRIPATAVHMPHLSLPNQPMNTTKKVAEILMETKLQKVAKIGVVGWKRFTSKFDDTASLFDAPHFLIESLKEIAPLASLQNATDVFIGEDGVRTTNNANEFAHYEFGAALAGNCILDAMDTLELGKTEMEVAQKLDAAGQSHSVVSIMATGARFEKANMYPSNKKIKHQDTISITSGYKGGLQSRGGYAIVAEDELPKGQEDYLERLAKPYYQAVVTWLEKIHIGMKGKALYDTIEQVLPQETYGWSLNPGHLCADEEWLASPIYPNSQEILKSGMLFQIDIIPSVSGYGGISCESGILLADESLRENIKKDYPEIWKRIEVRRNYMRQELGINLSDEIIPTSIATAFCRPFLLNKQQAFQNVK